MVRGSLAGAVFVLMVLGISAWAQEPSGEKLWEFGFDPGIVYPLSKGHFSHEIDNAVVYNILVREAIGDEISEGFVPPPLPGYSTIAATMKPMGELAAHVYYHADPGLSVGVEGGYGFKRNTYIDNYGIYSARFLELNYEASLLHLAGVARVSRHYGIFQPVLTFGPEWTLVHERAKVTFTDPDDTVDPEVVVDQMDTYLGFVGGAGIRTKCGENGAIEANFEYHKVFAPGHKLDYVTPQLRFIVYL